MTSFMEKLAASMEKYLAPVMSKMANNRYFSSIRDALTATMGLTVFGSLCLLVATFPFPQSYVDWRAANPEIISIIRVPFSLTVSIISVYVAFGIGYNLSKHYKMDTHIGGISALFTFLIMAKGLDGGSLGAAGMFTAILAGIISTEIARFCIEKNVVIKLPDQVPPNIAGGFTALIPNVLTGTLVVIVVYILGFDINAILTNVLTPLVTAGGDSVFTALVYVIGATLFWFGGLHPSILATILTPAWTIMAEENMLALSAQAEIPHIFVRPFFFAFIFIGGQCGTLMLNLLMFRSKSKTHRDLAKLALPAGLFNINEPMLFGLPIVLNPLLIIPALIGQTLSIFTTWGAFATRLVPGMGNPNAALWNLPAVIAAFVATNSWKAVVLVIVNMLIQGIIYIPFYKIAEKQMVDQEKGILSKE